MSNKNLKNLINSVKSKAENAKTNRDLLNSITDLVSYGQPIEFNYTVHKFISILSFAIFSLYSIGTYTEYLKDILLFGDELENMLFTLPFLIICLIPIFIIYNSENSLDNLSNYIFNKDKIQDNNLIYLSKNNDYFNKLRTYFSNNFNKGNHSRQFKYGYKTENGNFYHFEYVNSRIVMVPLTTTTSNGNGGTTTTTTMQPQTKYDYYNRYGFTFISENLNSLDLDKYKDLLSSFYDLSISTEGDMVCIETGSNLLRSKEGRKFGVDLPKEFYKELLGHTELEHLDSLLKIKRLMTG